jgi:hypothetical protein
LLIERLSLETFFVVIGGRFPRSVRIAKTLHWSNNLAMRKRSRNHKVRESDEMVCSGTDRTTGIMSGSEQPVKKKNPAAVALGRKGGLKGGKARAANMTKEERSASAKKAAAARWSHKSSSAQS